MRKKISNTIKQVHAVSFIVVLITMSINIATYANTRLDFPNTTISNHEVTPINLELYSIFGDSITNNNLLTTKIIRRDALPFSLKEVAENRYDLLTFSLTNKTSQPLLTFELDFFTSFDIYLFRYEKGKFIQIGNVQGNSHPLDKKYNKHIDFIYQLNIPTDSSHQYVAACKGKFPLIKYLAYAGGQNVIQEKTIEKETISKIYLGICLVMLLYNLFLYYSTRDKLYLYYVAFILFSCISQIDIKGLTYQHLWNGNEFMSTNNLLFSIPLAGLFGMLFIREFTQSKTIAPKLDRIYKYTPIVLFISAFGVMFFHRHIPYFGVSVGSALWGWMSFIITLVCYLRGNKSAIYMLIGQSLFQIGITVFVLAINGDIPNTPFTFYCLEIGSAADIVLLSLSLADRINILKKDKLEADQLAIENERKYFEELENRKVLLEKQVIEQTKELRTANFELKRQALSAQINPHFIFNVLNSIQSFVLDHKSGEAEKYIAKFSRLMRFYLDSSIKPSISLKEEIDALDRYLQLEQLRFDHSFEYAINFNNSITPSSIHIGSMLILPFIENAVWHGIRPIDYPGDIVVDIKLIDKKTISVEIRDNGLGINQTQNTKKVGHESNGVRITKQRLDLLHQKNETTLEFGISDRTPKKGTMVHLTVPFEKITQ